MEKNNKTESDTFHFSKSMELNKTVTLSFLITAVLFVCSFLLFTPGYGTNDDVGMSRVASGYYTGSPSEYLVYTNVIIGKVLKTLYAWNQDVDWYSVYLYSIHFLSMWFLLVLLLRVKNSSSFYSVLIFLILFAFFELRFLVRVQFTTTAAVSGVTGVFLIVSEAINEKRSIALNVTGVFLILLSFLCRSSAFYLVAVLLIPVVLVSLYDKRSRLLIGSLTVAVLLCMTAGLYNYYVYQSSPAWREFAEYNYYRSRLHGFPLMYDLKKQGEDLSELGWTQNDLSMFRNWNFTNKEVYSVDKIKRLIEIHSNLPSEDRENYSFDAWVQTLKSHYLVIGDYVTFIILTMMIFIVSRLNSAQANVITGVTLLLSLVLFLYLGFEGRLVERVSLPILYGVFLVSCYMALKSFGESNKKFVEIYYLLKDYLIPSKPLPEKDTVSLKETSDSRPVRRALLFLFRVVFVIILVLLAGFELEKQLNHVEQLSKNNIRREVKYANLLKGYGMIFQEINLDPTLISWGGYIPLGWQQPFKKYPILNDLKIINLGWATHSPNYEESLERSNITNIDLALLGRNDIFLCCRGSFIKYYRLYLKEKYGYYVIVENLGDDIFRKFIDIKTDRSNIFRLRIDPKTI